jgi:hypothetical protein
MFCPSAVFKDSFLKAPLLLTVEMVLVFYEKVLDPVSYKRRR